MGTPGRPHPEPPLVSPPSTGLPPYSPGLHASLPPEAARCPIPRTLRRPPRVQCGAPPARAARAGSAAGEGGRERGGRDARGGGGRAPLPLAPGLEGRRANQRVQEEPSPLRDAFIGLARAAQLSGTRPQGQVCKLGRRSAAHRWRKSEGSGPVLEAGSHGASTVICLLRLQVPSCARPSAHR